jgi:hypothetical protein
VFGHRSQTNFGSFEPFEFGLAARASFDVRQRFVSQRRRKLAVDQRR